MVTCQQYNVFRVKKRSCKQTRATWSPSAESVAPCVLGLQWRPLNPQSPMQHFDEWLTYVRRWSECFPTVCTVLRAVQTGHAFCCAQQKKECVHASKKILMFWHACRFSGLPLRCRLFPLLLFGRLGTDSSSRDLNDRACKWLHSDPRDEQAPRLCPRTQVGCGEERFSPPPPHSAKHVPKQTQSVGKSSAFPYTPANAVQPAISVQL